MRSTRRDRIGATAGFSLIELVISMGITLLALSAAMTAMKGLGDMRDLAGLSSDVHQSLRSSVNLITRDLMATGRLVPLGGVPIPSGANATPLNRPTLTIHPDVAARSMGVLKFAAGNVLNAVTPGNGMGPLVAGNPDATDMITILTVDTTPMCGATDSLDDHDLVAIANDGSTAQVHAATPINCVGDGIANGDIIMFNKGAIQMVTKVNGQTLTFAPGDPMNLNQRTAANGSIMALQVGGVFPAVRAYRVRMITYYIDFNALEKDATLVTRPRLMRRVNMWNDRVIANGVENLQVLYDLVDDVTNPKMQADTTAPNQIRKATVQLAERSSRPLAGTQEYVRNSLSTQVSLRGLALFDRYR